MRRREFLGLVGGAAAWPVVARAQQRLAIPVVGFLMPQTADGVAHIVSAFRQGLGETGYIEGQNVAIEYRFAENQMERLPALAADLVGRRVALIAAGPAPAAREAKEATSEIPIVFVIGADPVRFGLVPRLNRPGGNLTGFSFLGPDVAAKRFGLLHELVPHITSIGVLVDPNMEPINREFQFRELHEAANRLAVAIREVTVRPDRDFEATFAAAVKGGVGAFFVGTGAYFFGIRDRLVPLAARYRIPATYELREWVEAGGLTSYGPSTIDAWHKGGVYAGRILKGEKPADLPVQLPTKFEFVINLKTARALGLDIPPNVLAIADEVIE